MNNGPGEVVFLPHKQKVPVEKGASLLEAVRMAGLTLEAPCNGRGTCGKCRLKATGSLSSPGEKEIEHLGPLVEEGVRLACQAKIFGSAQVELTESEETFLTVEEGQNKTLNFNPLSIRKCFGIALDIGTTSIVAELINMESGETLGISSCLNPQTSLGGDVLTRISYAINQADGAKTLQSEVVKGINRLINNLCSLGGITNEEIFEVVVAANTTMLHLLLGVDPRSLAIAPYRAVFTHQLEVSPGAVGVKIAPGGVLSLLPSASAFVGADIIAGLLATGFYRYREPSLFIDIGTNGEIVALKDDLLVGTSSAAGPALEGMNISCGCRAERGAIERVNISTDGTINIKTIGHTAPIGLCGSGLIDLVAELVRVGLIESSGRLVKKENLPPGLSNRLIKHQGQPAFLVSESGDVVLTQKDIRQVQLAKGAIATGIELLLKELNLSYGEVQRVLVAGAFGYHLRPSSLTSIGLLPFELKEKIIFVGNTAKEGARTVLVNKDTASELHQICQRLKIKELSFLPEFQDSFVRQLAFRQHVVDNETHGNNAKKSITEPNIRTM